MSVKLIFILISLLLGAALLQFVKKYIFQMQGPSIDEVWVELGEQPWYQEWIRNDRMNAYLEHSKQKGLLSDPYYVKRVIHHKGTRDGFIEFMEKELAKFRNFE